MLMIKIVFKMSQREEKYHNKTYDTFDLYAWGHFRTVGTSRIFGLKTTGARI
jgi:hypothetical protein